MPSPPAQTPDPQIQTAEPQSAAAVLMVRPAHFASNPQTAASNSFQAAPAAGTDRTGTDLQALALREFDALADALQRHGVRVTVARDSEVPVKPDAIFPNNWVSFHRDGTVVLYPMLAPNRRLERREEIVRQAANEGGFRITGTVDLSYREDEEKFLEGTGSVVLDRCNRIAYAGISPRTDLDVLGQFAQQLSYEVVAFDAHDAAGKPVYHTNVLMAVGGGFAVLCEAAIADPTQRAAVAQKLRATGHEIIDISMAQMHGFAGNVLELSPAGTTLIAMSRAAWGSFTPAQRRRLESHGELLVADIPAIERAGGGSVRCMLAEIHLPGLAPGPMS